MGDTQVHASSEQVDLSQTDKRTSIEDSPDKEAVGCCFSLGYGAMMKPCCLEAHSVSDVKKCPVATRLGGASGYKLGKCPATSEEAAEAFNAQKRSSKTLMQTSKVNVALASPSSVQAASDKSDAGNSTQGPNVLFA